MKQGWKGGVQRGQGSAGPAVRSRRDGPTPPSRAGGHAVRDLIRRGEGREDGDEDLGWKVGARTRRAAVLPETGVGPAPAAERLQTRRGSPRLGR